jgi:hypothetical protein
MGKWHIGFHDLSVLGLLTTTGFLAVAWMSGRRALEAARDSPALGVDVQPWWIIFAIAFLLGVNKQLNLQTLFMDLGRDLSVSYGWFESRRSVQAAFVIASGILGLIAALFALLGYRTFWFAHRRMSVGLALVACYCLLRIAEINHVPIGADDGKDTRLWPIKLAGIGLMLWGAAVPRPLPNLLHRSPRSEQS